MAGHYRALVGWFGWLVERGHIDVSPMATVEAPHVPSREPKRTQPAQPDEPVFRSDWIGLPDGGFVRASEIYLVDIARNGDLIVRLRSQDDFITIDADDPLLGAFLDAVIYDAKPSSTDDPLIEF